AWLAPLSVALEDDEIVSGLAIGSPGNSRLEPERSSEIEVGLDADLFGGRMGAELTYYAKKTRGALVFVVLPPSTGVFYRRWVNVGEVENDGVEVALRGELLDGRALQWDAALTASWNDNLVTSLGEGVDNVGSRVRVGFPLYGQWARPIESFDDSDLNGIITEDEVVLGDTAAFAGPSAPQRVVTLSSGVTLFHRLRIQALVDHQGEYSVYNVTERWRCRWPYDQCRALVDPTASLEDQAAAAVAGRTHWGFIEDVSFIKLRELSLSYTLPDTWAERVRARSATVTLTGRNLVTWTGYSGVDPEVHGGGGLSNRGTWDLHSQAPYRYWTLRVRLGF
ncbi:MAG: TonB-dependent receptor domain-containing protein, partial [Planctomycetota bacterium]